MCLGVPGQICQIDADAGLRMGTVDFGGVRKQACLEYLPDAELGDWVLVHVGFAITKLDEAAARETLDLLAGVGLLDESLGIEADRLAGEGAPGAEGAGGLAGNGGGRAGAGGPGAGPVPSDAAPVAEASSAVPVATRRQL